MLFIMKLKINSPFICSSFLLLKHKTNSKAAAYCAASIWFPINSTASAIFSFKNCFKSFIHVRDVTIICRSSSFFFWTHNSLMMVSQMSGCFAMIQSMFSNAIHFNLSFLIACGVFLINSNRHGAVTTRILQPLYSLIFEWKIEKLNEVWLFWERTKIEHIPLRWWHYAYRLHQPHYIACVKFVGKSSQFR